MRKAFYEWLLEDHYTLFSRSNQTIGPKFDIFLSKKAAYNETAMQRFFKHMLKFLEKNQSNLWLLFLVVSGLSLLGLFCYQLGATALQSYDEAWYGSIARTMVETGNWVHLRYNGSWYSDHPPFGFILMALATTVLGSNEFSVRLVSVILGVGTVLVTMMLGKRLGGWSSGVTAGAVLVSSLWFMVRVRSGNLDVPFLFWECLTLWFLLEKKHWSLYGAATSFAALVMTKTMVGVGILPVVGYLVWQNRKQWKRKEVLAAGGLGLFFVLPWYLFMVSQDANFITHHFFEIGVRGQENGFTVASIARNLQYLAIGVGKWYKVFWLSLAGLMGLVVIRRYEQSIRLAVTFLSLWFLGFSVFLVSSKTEVWHLLPLYPVLAVTIGVAVTFGGDLLPKSGYLKMGAVLLMLALAGYQFKQFANLLYFSGNPFSAERDIAQKAARYQPVYLMETFLPATVYYSGQEVVPLHWDPHAYQTLVAMLQEDKPGSVIINLTTAAQLEADKVPFSIVESNNSYRVITAK